MTSQAGKLFCKRIVSLLFARLWCRPCKWPPAMFACMDKPFVSPSLKKCFQTEQSPGGRHWPLQVERVSGPHERWGISRCWLWFLPIWKHVHACPQLYLLSKKRALEHALVIIFGHISTAARLRKRKYEYLLGLTQPEPEDKLTEKVIVSITISWWYWRLIFGRSSLYLEFINPRRMCLVTDMECLDIIVILFSLSLPLNTELSKRKKIIKYIHLYILYFNVLQYNNIQKLHKSTCTFIICIHKLHKVC